MGIRCIISTSFADIFFNNSFKNGMLPIPLPKEDVAVLMKDAEEGLELSVDLPTQTITRGLLCTLPLPPPQIFFIDRTSCNSCSYSVSGFLSLKSPRPSLTRYVRRPGISGEKMLTLGLLLLLGLQPMARRSPLRSTSSVSTALSTD